MYYTNVTELCTAVQNIERKDLARILKRFNGQYDFNEQNGPVLELYSNGPCSAEVQSVRITESGTIRIKLAQPVNGEVDSSYVYPGHLTALSDAIVGQHNA